MKPELVQKFIEEVGSGHIAESLSDMPGADLHTLLMEVFARRVTKLTPSRIEAGYRDNRLVTPCPIEQRRLIEADALAYRTLDAQFKSVEFAPIMPLGTNAVLGGVNQKNVLGTIRGCEVLADPTTALALQCAHDRLQALADDPRSAERVAFATSARCLRLQRFDNIPGFVPHFKIFALATAGRDVGSEQFEVDAMFTHLEFYLAYIEGLRAAGCAMTDLKVDVSDARIMRAVVEQHKLNPAHIGRTVQEHESSVFRHYGLEWPQQLSTVADMPDAFVQTYRAQESVTLLGKLEREAIRPLQEAHPDVSFRIDLDRAAGMNYYTNGCFKIRATNRNGQEFPLADGGFADWTQKLLNSRKERLFTSGIGTELILANFA